MSGPDMASSSEKSRTSIHRVLTHSEILTMTPPLGPSERRPRAAVLQPGPSSRFVFMLRFWQLRPGALDSPVFHLTPVRIALFVY